MAQFTDLVYAIQLEATNPWIYTVIAVLLGLLHPFEPGPAGATAAATLVRGGSGGFADVSRRSVLAALQDTATLWAVALVALFASTIDIGLQENEPYILLVSGGLIIVTAFRLFNLHQMKLEPSYLVSATAFAGLATATSGAQGRAEPDPVPPSMLARLIPGPSVLALLLLCLQIDFLGSSTGIALAFCVGLAIALATLGFGGRNLRGRFAAAFAAWSAFLPYISVFLIIIIGLLSFVHGLTDLGL